MRGRWIVLAVILLVSAALSGVSRAETVVITKQPATVPAGQAAPSLTGKDLEMAKEMNTLYARNLYISSCVDKQKAYFTPSILTPEEMAKRMVSYGKSCACMADFAMKIGTPNDVIDFVAKTYTGTSEEPEVFGEEMADDEQSPIFERIRELTDDPAARRGCGLSP